MIASKNYIRQKAFRFRRWSHKSYALFNAIGKVIQIGCLSTIIHKLVTVKSMDFRGYLSPSEALEASEEEEGNAPINHELAGSTGLAAIMPAFFNAKFENPVSDSSVVYAIKIFVKAFSGPFLLLKIYYRNQ